MTEPAEPRSRWRPGTLALRILLVLVLLLFGAGLVAWLTRESIVRNIVEGELAKRDVEASYDLTEIGVNRQVVENLVIGDPERPDLTIDRLEIYLRATLTGVTIERVSVGKARLYGRYVDGKLSFGALDPLIFTGSDEPFDLPDLNVHIADGQARFDTDYGAVGIKLEGGGNLSGGFAGKLAAIAPNMSAEGCDVTGASIYGDVTVRARRPGFTGPIRFGSLSCPELGVAAGKSNVVVDLEADSALEMLTGDARLGLTRLVQGENRLARLAGDAEISISANGMSSGLDIEGNELIAGPMALGAVRLDGVLRYSPRDATLRFSGDSEGEGLALTTNAWGQADAAAKQLAETPLGPILAQIVRTGRPRFENARFATPLDLVGRSDSIRLILNGPQVEDARGRPLIEATRLAFNSGNARYPFQLSGDVRLVGEGLPRLRAAIRPNENGSHAIDLNLAEYRAGNAMLAVPRLAAVMAPTGDIRFTGAARMTGPIPAGRVEGLELPLTGRWSSAAGLSLYPDCTTIGFRMLRASNLRLDRQSLRLCPTQGAIVAQRGGEYRLAARVAQASLSGALSDTPLKVAAGSLDFALPGTLTANALDMLIGATEASGTRLQAAMLTATFGDIISGEFSGARAVIGPVPLLMSEGSGTWKYENEALVMAGESWQLSDRDADPRFRPLVSRDVALRLEDGIITADGTLLHPRTGRQVAAVDIRHDLGTGTGHADLVTRDLTFDETLQPDDLTRLALGVVANVFGTVDGEGRIDWNSDTVTSSGRYRTGGTSLAAAFGPVSGLSGEIVFNDLLGLETGPGQVIRLAEVNPGIAASDGVVRYQLLPDQKMRVEGGEWPFAGGKLILEPTTIDLANEVPRRFSFRVEGLDAAQFLQQLEFENLNATGTFDGVLPMVFDQNGGRIEGGKLTARAGGGTVEYVGELTYEDLSAIGNFAFNALKSLRYRELEILMDGAIDGEIVTQVRFAGIQQGENAQTNFITRQLAGLPIQFNVTIRAPFMQLVTSTRSLYDSSFLRDPRELDLIARPRPPVPPPPELPGETATSRPDDESDVQPDESETMP